MKFINFAIVKFSIFLSLGILSAKLFVLNANIFLYLSPAILLVLCIAWYIARKQLFQTLFFGSITFLCFFILGLLNYQLRLPKFHQKHYSHQVTNTDSLSNKPPLLQLKVKEVLKPNSYNTKYIASIISINKTKSKGFVLVNLKIDSLSELITTDNILLISSRIEEIKSPLNPYQFDYSKYMKTLGVYGQIRITNRDILTKTKGKSTLKGRSEKARNHIIAKLKESPLTPNELSIIQALILGQRKDISKEVYQDYAAAGAIHILAVSGLHVGIIYYILLFILSPLKKIRKGSTLISILIVICLWGFAFITGLSPSVVRAVTMFSFFAFATLINRGTNSINTLFLSYFVLLLINPMWLFHVGFQLSYLAVFFILWVLPIFNKLYYPKNRVLKKLWGIFTVTIAAQLGIIPLSLFYFHQFPGLFFLTNIVILPFLGFLLGGGIVIILLAILNILPFWIAISYNYLIKLLNNFINWIAHQESFLIQDIHFTSEKVLGSYLFIITLILISKEINFKRIVFGLLSVVLLICVFIWDDYKVSENELIAFHKSRHSHIGYKHAKNLTLFRSDSTFNNKNSYPINGYRIAQNISNYCEEKLPQLFKYNEKRILILDSLGVFPKKIDIDIVFLSSSPKFNLERMIDSLHPKQIIADGNNYTSYVNRWRKTCKEKNVSFHFTGTEGAYVIK